jgi:hypothetical protein
MLAALRLVLGLSGTEDEAEFAFQEFPMLDT